MTSFMLTIATKQTDMAKKKKERKTDRHTFKDRIIPKKKPPIKDEFFSLTRGNNT